ncbi:glycosyltransferase [Thermococcus sp. LS2]|uniref:glycosyltransferase family 2 protein n=1 Tax=Thermococcus sp. LS2 TaxID=1638260 RepID=UPI00143B3DD3|nr:glycosyltransferase [Thermococcus sp. LS2]NJE12848.1 glycosyltransferase [Thermococcus sp. LS2]
MTKPLVSIITPTYNHEKFIAKCIKSVLSQTYPHWEMIIIDDGSTDRTPEIVEQFNNERIHYLRQRNRGIWNLKKTYNRALKFADGELIAILEGDDFWPAYKLKQQIKAFRDNNVVLSWGKAGIVNNAGNYLSTWDIPHKLLHGSQSDILRELLLRNFIPAVTVMVRKEALLNIGGFKQPLNLPYVDYPTWLELATVGRFHPINKILGYWRRHAGQTTVKYFETMTVKARAYALSFFKNLSKGMQRSLKLTENDIIKYGLSRDYLALGMFALNSGNLDNAKRNFAKALGIGPFFTKILAMRNLLYVTLREVTSKKRTL